MSDTIDRGLFFLFEGGDKVGKTTQAREFVEYLRAHGKPVQFMAFPNRASSKTGERINAFLKGEISLSIEEAHLLFCQNRSEMASTITKLLSEGTSIVMDRYAFSGLAYTMAKWVSMGVTNGDLAAKREWAIQQESTLPAPDIIFYLELKPEEMAARFAEKDEIFDDFEFQRFVNAQFMEMIKRSNTNNLLWIYVNASHSIDRIHKYIIERTTNFRKMFSPTISSLTVY